jgi:hypothetical protein
MRPLHKDVNDIGAATKAAVHQRRHLRADHFDDLRQCVDRGAAAVVDDAAAVRDNDIINERGDIERAGRRRTVPPAGTAPKTAAPAGSEQSAEGRGRLVIMRGGTGSLGCAANVRFSAPLL